MFFSLELRPTAYTVAHTNGLSNVPHLHRHAEIIFMRKGATVAVCGNQEIPVEAGDLFIAFPDQVHYYLDKPGEHDLLLLIVSPDLCPEFRNDFTNYLPVSPVLKKDSVNPKIVTLLEYIVECDAAKNRYSDPEIRGSLMILLSELLKSLPLEQKQSYTSDLVANILTYCSENYTEDISLHTIADALQVSHYYISRIFHERLHISFRDYVNVLRIEKACALIQHNDLRITDIAFTVGYNSTRTFNRSFQKIMQMTPKEYREQTIS